MPLRIDRFASLPLLPLVALQLFLALPCAADPFLALYRGPSIAFQSLDGLDSAAWDSLGTASAQLLLYKHGAKTALPFAGADSLVFLDAKPGPKLARITVASGAGARTDVPVSAVLTGAAAHYPPSLLVLEELLGNARVPVPVQVAPDPPDETPSLWFIPPGRGEAGSTRSFELSCLRPAPAESLSLDLSATALDIRRGPARILRYNYGLIPGSAGAGPEFLRSGFIHPVFSPDGTVLSEDSPLDHHHHRGLFLAWVSTRFEGHAVDFWNLGSKQGTVRFTGFGQLQRGPVFAGFQAHHRHIDLTQAGGKPALDEDWNVKAWRVGGPGSGYWLWDLVSVQRCAGASPLSILKYYYGGLGLRAAKEWKGDKLALENPAGAAVNGTPAHWVSAAGESNGAWRRITFLSHPGNPIQPEPAMAFPELSFTGFHPALAQDWTLVPGQRYVLRYRVLVQDARGSAAQCEQAWEDFAHPPLVSFAPEAADNPPGLALRVTVARKNGLPVPLDLRAGESLRFTAKGLEAPPGAAAAGPIALADIRSLVFPAIVSAVRSPFAAPSPARYPSARDAAGRARKAARQGSSPIFPSLGAGARP